MNGHINESLQGSGIAGRSRRLAGAMTLVLFFHNGSAGLILTAHPPRRFGSVPDVLVVARQFAFSRKYSCGAAVKDYY